MSEDHWRSEALTILIRGTWLISSGYLRGTGDGSLGLGDIVIYDGARFTVSYDIQTPGTLTLLSSNSLMFLHQDCQFGAVIINGTSLPPGTYSYDQLIAQFPGNFASGGSGSISVSPTNVPSDVGDTSSKNSDIVRSAAQLIPVSLIAPDPPGGVIVSATQFVAGHDSAGMLLQSSADLAWVDTMSTVTGYALPPRAKPHITIAG